MSVHGRCHSLEFKQVQHKTMQNRGEICQCLHMVRHAPWATLISPYLGVSVVFKQSHSNLKENKLRLSQPPIVTGYLSWYINLIHEHESPYLTCYVLQLYFLITQHK